MKELPVFSILEKAAVQWPHHPAVHDEHGTMSFAELYKEAAALRSQLVDAGIGAGMGVGLKARNGRSFIIGLFAVAGCGAAVMPLYHQLRKEETETMLQDAQLHALLDDGSGPFHFSEAGMMLPMGIESFRLNFIDQFQGKIFAPHVKEPVFVRFTSGTTGRSKGVIMSHQTVIDRIVAGNKGLGLGPGDTVVWVLPMAYHFVVSIVLYVKFGAAIAVVKDFLARNIITITNQHRGTLLYASPLQIRLLAADNSGEMMPSLKKIISTSAGISVDVCAAFKKRFNKDVSQAYGIIEIGLPMMNMVKSAEHPDAVGYSLPDYEVAILDDDHRPLPAGETGQLGIRGPGMFDAYLLPAQPREDVLVNGFFLTADYAVQTADGLVKIAGRAKSVINISGIKVFPEEIEAVLESLPGIRQARISSIPHALLGQLIEGEIVVEPGSNIDTEEVLTYCRKRLSNFKAPQRLRIVDELPMTGTGKLKR